TPVMTATGTTAPIATASGTAFDAGGDVASELLEAGRPDAGAPLLDDPGTTVDTDQARTIWVAGDSTVANGNTPCPTGWAKHFSELFTQNITVVNSAAGGRSVRTWMYQVESEMGPDDECLITSGPDGQPLLQQRWQAML